MFDVLWLSKFDLKCGACRNYKYWSWKWFFKLIASANWKKANSGSDINSVESNLC